MHGSGEEILKANESYVVTFGSKGSMPMPPAKKLLIVTCMDARVETFGQLGLKLGESHTIRNAGGSVEDSLRSIVISQRLLGTREIAVFRHTDCGMMTFQGDDLRQLVKKEDPDNKDVVSWAEGTQFLEFSDPYARVLEDVEFLQKNPLVLKETVITGWVYHVETGEVKKII